MYRQGIERQDAVLRSRAVEGWKCHPGYVFGARRISCMLCGISLNQAAYKKRLSHH